MSDRSMWYDRCDFIQRVTIGIDPTTRLEKFTNVKILSSEPCDLYYRQRRVGQQTASGTVYNVVETPYLRVFPHAESSIPDENDEIVVNGAKFRIQQRQDYRDPGSNRYMGTLLTLERAHGTDTS